MSGILGKSLELGEEESLSPIAGQEGSQSLQQGLIQRVAGLQSDSQIKGVSIVASHGKRMICILRSFLLDYDDLKLELLEEDCINEFYRKIREVNNKGFIKEDKWWGLKKSKCKIFIKE